MSELSQTQQSLAKQCAEPIIAFYEALTAGVGDEQVIRGMTMHFGMVLLGRVLPKYLDPPIVEAPAGPAGEQVDEA